MQSLLSVTRRFLEPTDFQLGLDKENKIYGACRPPAISLPAWHCIARVLATARVSAAGAPAVDAEAHPAGVTQASANSASTRI